MKQPDYVAYSVVEGNGQTRWRGVGVAFKGRDKDSLTVLLDAVPLSGKVVLMPPKERDSEQTSREPGAEG